MIFVFHNPNTGAVDEFATLDEANIAFSNAIAFFKTEEKRRLKPLFFVSQITVNNDGTETWAPVIDESHQGDGLYAVTNSLDGLPARCNSLVEVEQSINDCIETYLAPTISGCVVKGPFTAKVKAVDRVELYFSGTYTSLFEEMGVLVVPPEADADFVIPKTYGKEQIKPLFERYGFNTLKETVLTNTSTKQDFDAIEYPIFTKTLNDAGGRPSETGVTYRSFPNGAALYAEVQNSGLSEFSIVAQETFYSNATEPRGVMHLVGVVNGKSEFYYLPADKSFDAGSMDDSVSAQVPSDVVEGLVEKFKVLLRQENIKNTHINMQFLESPSGEFYPIDFNFSPPWRILFFYAQQKREYAKDLYRFCFDMIESLPVNTFGWSYKFVVLNPPDNHFVNEDKARAVCSTMGCAFAYTGIMAWSNPPIVVSEAPSWEEAQSKVEQCEAYLNENIHLITDAVGNFGG